MFYYGLDFHDLAPNFILNISAFIVVCEAFLRIQPHFGLWLKIFSVKPKVMGGRQAECGGAMVGKIPNVTWLEGAFVETIKGWQSGWFYITEPRDPEWAAAPEFRSGIPTRLTSWKETGLSWGNSAEVTRLQTCIKDLISRKVKLVTVVQVMLFRRILPCQRRALTCGSSTRPSTRLCPGSSTQSTRMHRRCYSRAPRSPLPSPRIADSAPSAEPAR